jgi:hypothetical protein
MRNQSHAMNVWLWGGVILLATLAIGFVLQRLTEPAALAIMPFPEPDMVLVVPSNRAPSVSRAPAVSPVLARPAPHPFGVNQAATPRMPPSMPQRRVANAMPKPVPHRGTTLPLPGRMDHSAMAELQRRIATNLRDAWAYCGALPVEQQATAYHILFARWVQQDPAAAVQAAQELPENLRGVILSQTLTQLAITNPEAVLAILASVSGISDELRSQFARRAISEIGRRDPVAALQALSALPMTDSAQQADVVNQILSHWIVSDKATALAWLHDAAVDDATYDTALVSAISQMSHRGDLAQDAATLFREFVEGGRMDNISDPALRSQAVLTAKLLGVALGSKDYATALQWGFELPADSSAQAYILSNVAFSQTHGDALPDISWVANMAPGFARTRVVAAISYGRLLAHGEVEAGTAIRQQLDSDKYDLGRVKAMVEQANLTRDEKQALLALF